MFILQIFHYFCLYKWSVKVAARLKGLCNLFYFYLFFKKVLQVGTLIDNWIYKVRHHNKITVKLR